MTTVLIVSTTTFSEVVPRGSPARGQAGAVQGAGRPPGPRVFAVLPLGMARTEGDLAHWGLTRSQPPLFFLGPVNGGLVLWVLDTAYPVKPYIRVFVMLLLLSM